MLKVSHSLLVETETNSLGAGKNYTAADGYDATMGDIIKFI